MDITRAILDGIAMAAIFNGAVAAFVLINPRFFFDSYPKAIQNSAPDKMTKEEKRINLILTIIISGIVFIYGVTSLLHTGIRGLRDLLDELYSVDNIKLGRFPLVGCTFIPRKVQG